jgi:hypothetical protein
MNIKLPSFLIALLVVCFQLSQNAHAVTPPPDGGYPGNNTAEGTDALFNLTSGTDNTAVGLFSLRSNRTGSFNTAVGSGALILNTAGQNTATGAQALLNNTTGPKNTADGAFALASNSTGGSNTASGHQALFNNTSGSSNTANGVNALGNNFNGSSNTANGAGALISNGGGNFNTASGASALLHNTTGSRNIALGAAAGKNVTSANNVICIGADGANASNTCYIGSIFGALSSGGAAVFINANGKLGTVQCSRRFKDDIKPMEQASDGLFALKPVTFRYKKEIDPKGIPQFGLVAEDVEQVNPDLVVRDNEGKTYSVRYDQINAMLLNEFLKEHRKVQEQEATIAELKSDAAKEKATISQLTKGMEAVVACLKDHDAKIQKVSDQIEAAKTPVARITLNKP